MISLGCSDRLGPYKVGATNAETAFLCLEESRICLTSVALFFKGDIMIDVSIVSFTVTISS
jgi:hypothetical protein